MIPPDSTLCQFWWDLSSTYPARNSIRQMRHLGSRRSAVKERILSRVFREIEIGRVRPNPTKTEPAPSGVCLSNRVESIVSSLGRCYESQTSTWVCFHFPNKAFSKEKPKVCKCSVYSYSSKLVSSLTSSPIVVVTMENTSIFPDKTLTKTKRRSKLTCKYFVFLCVIGTFKHSETSN